MDDGNDHDAIVVGAGLTGSMVALLLAQSGINVGIIEKRSDTRQQFKEQKTGSHGQFANPNNRSINLALSFRGISTLIKAGIFEQVQPLLVPMEGRCIHQLSKDLLYQPYGHKGQAIYSVSRLALNEFLLSALEKTKNIHFQFDAAVERVDPSGSILIQHDGVRSELKSKLIIGADGAFSTVRDSLSKCCRIDVAQTFSNCGYKEFTIPSFTQGQYALPLHNCLHIWPRHDMGMIVALPNTDFTFTCTLFAPWDGEYGLQTLDRSTDQYVIDYFNKFFPDIFPMVPDLLAQFRSNPSSPLLTVKANPWNKGSVLLMGDAAHAVLPFYGQGMNAGFEDALLFSEIWEEFHHDAAASVDAFNARRQEAGIALADLSYANYIEMSSLTDTIAFRAKKRLESVLSSLFPRMWIPLYTMVSFTRIPYNKAQSRARRQNRVLYCVMGVLGLTIVSAGLASSLQYRSILPSPNKD
uniref:FAD-binding domain-containing protein n=1 Tax=Spongospora subterranea TaxID=70186 RepID=A0A0H5QGU0_9EUKA|eukprot:CRZ01195.1 hypothetical protein [Spongospora subterranea]